MPVGLAPGNCEGLHSSSNALKVNGVGIAAAQSLCGRIRVGVWWTPLPPLWPMLGLGEEPGFRGEGLGLGEPPSGEAADGKGEPDS